MKKIIVPIIFSPCVANAHGGGPIHLHPHGLAFIPITGLAFLAYWVYKKTRVKKN